MDDFSKIAVGCASVFAIALLVLMFFAITNPITTTATASSGNFIVQNTVKYGNSTTYMLQWNGTKAFIEVYSSSTLTYSNSVVNGGQITVVLSNGQPATLYANYNSVMQLNP
jgi:hypothetical protein